MRKDPNNKNNRVVYVLLPLFIEDKKGETDNEAIEATCFDEIWDVLTSLKEFDPILDKIMNKMSVCFQRYRKATWWARQHA